MDAAPEQAPTIDPGPQALAPPDRSPAAAPQAAPQALSLATPTDQPSNETPEDYSNGVAASGIKADRWEQLGAFVRGASDKSAVGIPGLGDGGWAVRKANEWIQDKVWDSDTPKMTPEQANKAFPGMPEPFNEPIDPGVARMQYDHFNHTRQMENWAATGGPAPVTQFAAGIGVGFVDPANILLGIATGGVATLAGASGSVRNVLLQNLAINAGLSAGGYAAEKSEHLAPSAMEAATGAVEGALGGTAFHFALSGLNGALRSGVDALRGTPAEVREANVRGVIAQIDAGARPNIEAGSMETAARARGDISGERSPLRFTPAEHPSDVPMYGAREAEGKAISSTQLELGKGLTLTQDGNRASNMVVNNETGEHGSIGQYNLPKDSKFVDLEQSARSPEAEKFLADVEKITGGKIEPGEADTLKDVLSQVDELASRGGAPADSLDRIQEAAKADGYAGYTFKAGEEVGAQNIDHVHLFDENAKPDQVFTPNSEVAPSMSTADRLQALQDTTKPDAKAYYTPENAADIHELRTQEPIGKEADFMDEPIQAMQEQALTKLKEWAKDDPALAKELETTLKHEDAIDKQEKGVMQKLADCLLESAS